jgi:hypothetical protein
LSLLKGELSALEPHAEALIGLRHRVRGRGLRLNVERSLNKHLLGWGAHQV